MSVRLIFGTTLLFIIITYLPVLVGDGNSIDALCKLRAGSAAMTIMAMWSRVEIVAPP